MPTTPTASPISRLLDAIDLLAEIGYEGVSITLDHGALDPFDPRLDEQLDEVAAALDERKLRCVIETGARFLLDPRKKHEPTLVTADPAARARRVDFLCRAIDIAARLDADCVSLWSGVVHDGAGQADALSRLTEGLAVVLDHANDRGVDLAFEPEPGMLVDTLAAYERLLAELDRQGVDTTRLRLTIDIGHLHCQAELPIPAKIREFAAEAGQCPHRRHAGRRPRAPPFWRRRDRFSAGYRGAGRNWV